MSWTRAADDTRLIAPKLFYLLANLDYIIKHSSY